VSSQRQFPRFAHEAAVKLVASGEELTGRTANLSRGGLCAMVDAPTTVGIIVECELALVFDNDTFSEPLTLRARVVWCTPVENRYQVGLSFAPVDPQAIQYLEMFLKFLKEGRRQQTPSIASNGDPFG